MIKLLLLNRKPAPRSSKCKEKMKLVKTDSWLFSDLYAASQSRAGDLHILSAHKNHVFRVWLSEYGNLCGCRKLDFIVV